MSEPLSSAEWQDARRVLAIRLDAIGDVLMTEPALRALAQAIPGRRLTLLTSSSGQEAARLMPYLEDVLVYDAPWMKATSRSSSAEDRAMVESLRARQFDAAVIFTVYTQSALPAAWLCYLADIPRRAAHCRENPYRLLTHWLPETEPATHVRHEVRRQLDLVTSIGAMVTDDRLSIALGSAAIQSVDHLLSERIDPARRWLVLHPGATAASRRYPVDRFAAAAARLVQSLDCQIIWTGSQEEVPLIGQAQRVMGEPSHSLAGLLTFEEFAALIARAPVLISNNTSAVHLASAVATPVVDLYALTNPQHTPWRIPSRVLFEDVPCRWCYKSVCPEGHHQCLQGVAPDAVVSATLDLLEETTDPSHSSPVSRGETKCLLEDDLPAPASQFKK